MNEYEYKLDRDTLEIFPSEINANPLVVFHGTTSYHSENIERNGFCVNTTPYNIDHVEIIVNTLKNDPFSNFDKKKGFFNWTTSFGIEHYLGSIEKKEFRLSFSPVSYACVSFTESQTKGGQAFRDIREAKEVIDFAIRSDKSLEKLIPDEVNSLFMELEKIDKSQGVVYAIKLLDDLDGIECDMNNVVYSLKDISKEQIIGKVFIPATPTEYVLAQNALNNKIKTKLHNNGGLGVIIWRKQNEQIN